jgi:hypothetical protein
MEEDSNSAKTSSATACKRPYRKNEFASEAALALRKYVGGAEGRFAIAVYYASAENWDNHARLSRTRSGMRTFRLLILIRLVVGVEPRTPPKHMFRRRYEYPPSELSLTCGNASPQHTACGKSAPLPSAPQPPFSLPHAPQHSAHAR